MVLRTGTAFMRSGAGIGAGAFAGCLNELANAEGALIGF